jgi:hypothetical protein
MIKKDNNFLLPLLLTRVIAVAITASLVLTMPGATAWADDLSNIVHVHQGDNSAPYTAVSQSLTNDAPGYIQLFSKGDGSGVVASVAAGLKQTIPFLGAAEHAADLAASNPQAGRLYLSSVGAANKNVIPIIGNQLVDPYNLTGAGTETAGINFGSSGGVAAGDITQDATPMAYNAVQSAIGALQASNSTGANSAAKALSSAVSWGGRQTSSGGMTLQSVSDTYNSILYGKNPQTGEVGTKEHPISGGTVQSINSIVAQQASTYIAEKVAAQETQIQLQEDITPKINDLDAQIKRYESSYWDPKASPTQKAEAQKHLYQDSISVPDVKGNNTLVAGLYNAKTAYQTVADQFNKEIADDTQKANTMSQLLDKVRNMGLEIDPNIKIDQASLDAAVDTEVGSFKLSRSITSAMRSGNVDSSKDQSAYSLGEIARTVAGVVGIGGGFAAICVGGATGYAALAVGASLLGPIGWVALGVGAIVGGACLIANSVHNQQNNPAQDQLKQAQADTNTKTYSDALAQAARARADAASKLNEGIIADAKNNATVNVLGGMKQVCDGAHKVLNFLSGIVDKLKKNKTIHGLQDIGNMLLGDLPSEDRIQLTSAYKAAIAYYNSSLSQSKAYLDRYYGQNGLVTNYQKARNAYDGLLAGLLDKARQGDRTALDTLIQKNIACFDADGQVLSSQQYQDASNKGETTYSFQDYASGRVSHLNFFDRVGESQWTTITEHPGLFAAEVGGLALGAGLGTALLGSAAVTAGAVGQLAIGSGLVIGAGTGIEAYQYGATGAINALEGAGTSALTGFVGASLGAAVGKAAGAITKAFTTGGEAVAEGAAESAAEGAAQQSSSLVQRFGNWISSQDNWLGNSYNTMQDSWLGDSYNAVKNAGNVANQFLTDGQQMLTNAAPTLSQTVQRTGVLIGQTHSVLLPASMAAYGLGATLEINSNAANGASTSLSSIGQGLMDSVMAPGRILLVGAPAAVLGGLDYLVSGDGSNFNLKLAESTLNNGTSSALLSGLGYNPQTVFDGADYAALTNASNLGGIGGSVVRAAGIAGDMLGFAGAGAMFRGVGAQVGSALGKVLGSEMGAYAGSAIGGALASAPMTLMSIPFFQGVGSTIRNAMDGNASWADVAQNLGELTAGMVFSHRLGMAAGYTPVPEGATQSSFAADVIKEGVKTTLTSGAMALVGPYSNLGWTVGALSAFGPELDQVGGNILETRAQVKQQTLRAQDEQVLNSMTSLASDSIDPVAQYINSRGGITKSEDGETLFAGKVLTPEQVSSDVVQRAQELQQQTSPSDEDSSGNSSFPGDMFNRLAEKVGNLVDALSPKPQEVAVTPEGVTMAVTTTDSSGNRPAGEELQSGTSSTPVEGETLGTRGDRLTGEYNDALAALNGVSGTDSTSGNSLDEIHDSGDPLFVARKMVADGKAATLKKALSTVADNMVADGQAAAKEDVLTAAVNSARQELADHYKEASLVARITGDKAGAKKADRRIDQLQSGDNQAEAIENHTIASTRNVQTSSSAPLSEADARKAVENLKNRAADMVEQFWRAHPSSDPSESPEAKRADFLSRFEGSQQDQAIQDILEGNKISIQMPVGAGKTLVVGCVIAARGGNVDIVVKNDNEARKYLKGDALDDGNGQSIISLSDFYGGRTVHDMNDIAGRVMHSASAEEQTRAEQDFLDALHDTDGIRVWNMDTQGHLNTHSHDLGTNPAIAEALDKAASDSSRLIMIDEGDILLGDPINYIRGGSGEAQGKAGRANTEAYTTIADLIGYSIEEQTDGSYIGWFDPGAKVQRAANVDEYRRLTGGDPRSTAKAVYCFQEDGPPLMTNAAQEIFKSQGLWDAGQAERVIRGIETKDQYMRDFERDDNNTKTSDQIVLAPVDRSSGLSQPSRVLQDTLLATALDMANGATAEKALQEVKKSGTTNTSSGGRLFSGDNKVVILSGSLEGARAGAEAYDVPVKVFGEKNVYAVDRDASDNGYKDYKAQMEKEGKPPMSPEEWRSQSASIFDSVNKPRLSQETSPTTYPSGDKAAQADYIAEQLIEGARTGNRQVYLTDDSELRSMVVERLNGLLDEDAELRARLQDQLSARIESSNSTQELSSRLGDLGIISQFDQNATAEENTIHARDVAGIVIGSIPRAGRGVNYAGENIDLILDATGLRESDIIQALGRVERRTGQQFTRSIVVDESVVNDMVGRAFLPGYRDALIAAGEARGQIETDVDGRTSGLGIIKGAESPDNLSPGVKTRLASWLKEMQDSSQGMVSNIRSFIQDIGFEKPVQDALRKFSGKDAEAISRGFQKLLNRDYYTPHAVEDIINEDGTPTVREGADRMADSLKSMQGEVLSSIGEMDEGVKSEDAKQFLKGLKDEWGSLSFDSPEVPAYSAEGRLENPLTESSASLQDRVDRALGRGEQLSPTLSGPRITDTTVLLSKAIEQGKSGAESGDLSDAAAMRIRDLAARAISSDSAARNNNQWTLLASAPDAASVRRLLAPGQTLTAPSLATQIVGSISTIGARTRDFGTHFSTAWQMTKNENLVKRLLSVTAYSLKNSIGNGGVTDTQSISTAAGTLTTSLKSSNANVQADAVANLEQWAISKPQVVANTLTDEFIAQTTAKADDAKDNITADLQRIRTMAYTAPRGSVEAGDGYTIVKGDAKKGTATTITISRTTPESGLRAVQLMQYAAASGRRVVVQMAKADEAVRGKLNAAAQQVLKNPPAGAGVVVTNAGDVSLQDVSPAKAGALATAKARLVSALGGTQMSLPDVAGYRKLAARGQELQSQMMKALQSGDMKQFQQISSQMKSAQQDQALAIDQMREVCTPLNVAHQAGLVAMDHDSAQLVASIAGAEDTAKAEEAVKQFKLEDLSAVFAARAARPLMAKAVVGVGIVVVGAAVVFGGGAALAGVAGHAMLAGGAHAVGSLLTTSFTGTAAGAMKAVMYESIAAGIVTHIVQGQIIKRLGLPVEKKPDMQSAKGMLGTMAQMPLAMGLSFGLTSILSSSHLILTLPGLAASSLVMPLLAPAIVSGVKAVHGALTNSGTAAPTPASVPTSSTPAPQMGSPVPDLVPAVAGALGPIRNMTGQRREMPAVTGPLTDTGKGYHVAAMTGGHAARTADGEIVVSQALPSEHHLEAAMHESFEKTAENVFSAKPHTVAWMHQMVAHGEWMHRKAPAEYNGAPMVTPLQQRMISEMENSDLQSVLLETRDDHHQALKQAGFIPAQIEQADKTFENAAWAEYVKRNIAVPKAPGISRELRAAGEDNGTALAFARVPYSGVGIGAEQDANGNTTGIIMNLGPNATVEAADIAERLAGLGLPLTIVSSDKDLLAKIDAAPEGSLDPLARLKAFERKTPYEGEVLPPVSSLPAPARIRQAVMGLSLIPAIAGALTYLVGYVPGLVKAAPAALTIHHMAFPAMLLGIVIAGGFYLLARTAPPETRAPARRLLDQNYGTQA